MMKPREDLNLQLNRAVNLFDEIYFMHGKLDPQNYSQFPKGFHTSVDLWLAGMEGIQSTLEWTLGKSVFYEAFYLMTADYLKKMRLNYWDDKWAYLPFDGPLSFEMQETPHFQIVQEAWVKQMLDRAVAVQNRVLTIERTHPGKWSPMFHGRVKKWLVNVENVIRVADWIVGNRTTENAFYLMEPKTVDQLDRARRTGILPVGMDGGGQEQINKLVGMDIGAEDHKPGDFK